MSGVAVDVVWILAALSAGFGAAFLYPYLIYPGVMRLLPIVPIRRAPTDLTTALLFCVYNEAEVLPGKLDNLRRLKSGRPELEILIYDDSSTDGSGEMLARESDWITVIPGPGRTGKAAGMKQLAQATTADILIFTDADVILSDDLVDRLLPYYAEADVGGVSGTLRSASERGSATSQVGSAYTGWDDRLQQLESATGNVMGASGGLFSVRRDLYPNFPDTVQDDFTVSMSVIFQGKRLVKGTDVIAFENAVTRREEETRRKIRIGARAFHTHLCFRHQVKAMSTVDRFKYVSHKMLRWFGGIFLALSGLFALAAILTINLKAALVTAAVGIVALAIGMRARRGPVGKLAEIVLATYATLIGVFMGLFGQTVATWSPAKSR